MSSLICYNKPISSLPNWLDGFFNDSFFESIDREIVEENFPRVDISEKNNSYIIKADLPGMDKRDISITIEKGMLKIEGVKKEENKKEQGKYYHLERRYGRFSRSFILPDEVIAEKIDAKINNGVLELTLPKSEKAMPKTIEVKIQ